MFTNMLQGTQRHRLSAKSILENGEVAVEKYKGFLKAGGSLYPIDTLKNAGVDMTTSMH